jgi:erythromycin esterase-like protein
MFDFDGSVKKYRPFMYSPPGKKNAIEYWLNEVKYPAFLLACDQFKEIRRDSFFSVNRYQRLIGAKHQNKEDKDYISMPVNKCFDGIIFIKRTTAAENVN